MRLPGADPLVEDAMFCILELRPERVSDLAELIEARSDAYFSGNALLGYVKWTLSVLWAVLGGRGYE